MIEYYGISKSSASFIAHYGIKGMRWGVRKAIIDGNAKAYNNQYLKAVKKLNKLSKRADIEVQKENVKKHNKRAAIALGVGLIGVGGVGSSYLLNKKARDAIGASSLLKPRSRKKKYIGEGKDFAKNGSGLSLQSPIGGGYLSVSNEEARKYLNNYSTASSPNKTSKTKIIREIGAGIGAVGLGAAAYHKSRALAAKYRITNKGHINAVAKRDAWQNEMAKVFSGTKYRNRR